MTKERVKNAITTAMTAAAASDVDAAIANVQSSVRIEATSLDIDASALGKCLGSRIETIREGLIRQRRRVLEAELLAKYQKDTSK